MSILIKGMEMPIFEHQSWDIRKGADGKWYMVDTNAETSDGVWHEIIPITPHGRLIDADRLIDRLKNQIDKVGKDTVLAERNRDIISIIDSLSPVISADTESSNE